jgi:hypothetical protein
MGSSRQLRKEKFCETNRSENHLRLAPNELMIANGHVRITARLFAMLMARYLAHIVARLQQKICESSDANGIVQYPTESDRQISCGLLATLRYRIRRLSGALAQRPTRDLECTVKGEEVRETIRLTHHGARMYLELTLPNVTIKMDGDEIVMRLVIANSYDGSRKVQLAFGAYRLVCSNGMDHLPQSKSRGDHASTLSQNRAGRS